MIRTIAPAKINWTLEVLGKRPDGYHEVLTVMQTIDLCDEVQVERARENSLEVSGDYVPGEDDLALQAARLVTEATGGELHFAVRLTKRVPLAAGLGGGSSDGAAVLRAVDRLCGTADFDPKSEVRGLGSDAPFFLRGGTALASGRGEVIEPGRDVSEMWLVVLVPGYSVREKTRLMYARIKPGSFTDGRRSGALFRLIEHRKPIDESLLFNAFDGVAGQVFTGIDAHRRAFESAAGKRVHLAGAGPALFSVHSSRAEAEGTAARLGSEHGRVFVARTLGAAEATRILD